MDVKKLIKSLTGSLKRCNQYKIQACMPRLTTENLSIQIAALKVAEAYRKFVAKDKDIDTLLKEKAKLDKAYLAYVKTKEL